MTRTTTLRAAIEQAIEDHGDGALWSDGGQDWTLDNYLDVTEAAHREADHRCPRCAEAECEVCGAPLTCQAQDHAGRLRCSDHIDCGCCGAAEEVPCAGWEDECAQYEDEPVYYDGTTIRRYRPDGAIDTGEPMLRLRARS